MKISKVNGKMSKESKMLFSEHWKGLEDNRDYDFFSRKLPNGYHPTRYKYYFDAILAIALPVVKQYCYFDTPSGLKAVDSVEQLHEFLKLQYNPIRWVNMATGEGGVMGGSTTLLSDRDFIGSYMEQVIAEFSGPPYNLEFPLYEEWKDLHKRGVWYHFKQECIDRINCKQIQNF